MTNEEWDALEQEAWERGEWPTMASLENDRVDLVRIRGFAIGMATHVARAAADVDKAITAAERARKKAEASLATFHRMADLAELACSFASRVMAGDVDEETRGDVATLLEEMIG